MTIIKLSRAESAEEEGVSTEITHACRFCVFCLEIPNPKNLGAPGLTCFRYPPAVVNVAGGQYSVLFPTVMPEWRCGEYQEDGLKVDEEIGRRLASHRSTRPASA